MVHVFPDLEGLSRAAAVRVAELARNESQEAPFLMALSGGSTPRRLHEILATEYRDAVPWDRVHLFWGDERWVPSGHPDSNFRMAADTLLRHVPIPAENVHRVRTELGSPEEAALAYEQEIDHFLGTLAKPGLDLVLLGLGDDGHTASLFPGTPVLNEQARTVAAVEAPPYAPVRQRVTFTYPLINRSRHVFFLAAGESKREPLTHLLQQTEAAAQRYPAALVRGMVSTEWFIDQAANPHFGF